MLRVLIVDDEPLARTRMRQMLSSIGNLDVVAEAGNAVEAKELCTALKPEVVILDVRMPNGDGISLGREFSQLNPAPALIYCTAYERYALDAFNAGADAFLLKPIRSEQLSRALKKATTANLAQRIDKNDSAGRRYLTIKSRRGLSVLPIEDVRYFYADQKYVMAVTPNGERVLDDALRQLETDFGDLLLRVHRNALVCLQHVTGLTRLSSGQYQVDLAGIEGGPVVSRRHLSNVRSTLSKM